MTIAYLESLFIVPVMVICMVVGYIIKNVVTGDKMNRFIPLIVATLGLGLAISGALMTKLPITVDLIAAGLVTGLASTGFHQLVDKLTNRGEAEPMEEVDE